MTTRLFFNRDGLAHEMPPGHPEQIARLRAIEAALSGPEFDGLERMPAVSAEREALLLGHPEAYIDAIYAASPNDGMVALDGDTSMSPGSLNAALKGVGSCLSAIDNVLAGDCRNAFVATRPPGHHAEKTRAMGFCLFGSVAIAAKYVLETAGLSRVAVVDFDVHHGNGTQDILWDVKDCLFISSHQMPLYPGTGSVHEQGVYGNIVNVPLDPGTGSDHMRRIYSDRILPKLRDYNPDLILISAGFDAHRDDPLANLNWTTEDFAWLTREICTVAGDVCDGRVVSSLEGGYNLEALAESVAAHVLALMEG